MNSKIAIKCKAKCKNKLQSIAFAQINTLSIQTISCISWKFLRNSESEWYYIKNVESPDWKC